MPRPRSLPNSFYDENFKILAKKQTHHRVKIRLMAMHHIQQGHTYAHTAKTYLVNINAVNQWIARYKKEGVKGLNEKPHLGRNGLFAKQSLTTIFDSIVKMNKDKQGGRVRLIEIDQLLKDKFDIHYKDLNGVHNLMNRLNISWISARSKHPKQDLEAQSLYKKRQTKGSRCFACGHKLR